MKILLVQHASNNGLTSYPIGLGCVAAELKEKGHTVDFIDLGLEEAPVQALSKRIREFGPQALGFTLWTTNYSEYLQQMKECAEVADIPKVVGGPHASADAKQILEDGHVDVAVLCEGELIAGALFTALEAGSDLSAVNGIAYLKDGVYTETSPAGTIEDLDAWPSPPYEMLNINSYRGRLKGRPSVEMLVSRGCPYKCSFCYRGPSSTTKVCRMSPERVMTELQTMNRDYGFNSFFFVDDTFTLQRDWAVDLCKRIIDSGMKPAWACQTRVDAVDRELLTLMKQSGCVAIHFGVESGNQDVMDKLIKDQTLDQARKALAECQRLRISTFAYFLFGTPWDTEETSRQTIDFAKELKSTISLFFAATPYPGCPMREDYIKAGMPVPQSCDEYGRFWVENAPKGSEEGVRRAGNLDTFELCLSATREIVKDQVRDIKSYPRLITEFIDQYGFADFARNAYTRLKI